MHARFIVLPCLLVSLLLLSPCTPRGKSTAPTDPSNNATEPAAAVHGDPTEGQASLIDALRAAGAQVEPGDPVVQDLLSVPGQVIKVNGADVQVFEYASADAMEADAAQVSPDGSSIGTSMVTWMAKPHFFKAGRLLVLYIGDDAAVLDVLKSALDEQFAGR